MSNAKTSIPRRLLAALLALVLTMGILPVSTLAPFAATAEHPGFVTISVTDKDGKPLENASVTYSINSTASGEYERGSGTTDENGCIEVLAEDRFVADDLKLSATAELAEDSGTITDAVIESGTQDFVIQLKNTPAELPVITDVTIKANSGLIYKEDENLNGVPQALVTVTGAKDGEVTYTVDGYDTKNAKEAERADAGEYRVKVKVERAGYSPMEFPEMRVVIASAKIDGITVKPVMLLQYTGEAQNLVKVNGSIRKGDQLTWYVNGTETICEEVTENGEFTVPQATNAGTYKIRLKIERKNFETKYIPDDGFVQAEIARFVPSDKDFCFSEEKYNKEGSSVECVGGVPYENCEFDFSAVTELSGGTISYEVSREDAPVSEEEASIDADGKLTVKYPGKYTVTATLEGENLEEKSITHTLYVSGKVENNGDYICFEKPEDAIEPVQYVLGTGDLVCSLWKAKHKDDRIRGGINYSICIQSDDEGLAEILVVDTNGNVWIAPQNDKNDKKDYSASYQKIAEAMQKNDGKLKLTVYAEKEESYFTDTDIPQYGADKISYEIEILFAASPEEPYTLSEALGDDGWYNIENRVKENRDDNGVLVVTAREGYKVAQNVSDFFREGGDASETAFANEGIIDRYVYLRDENGGITDRIEVLDKKEPVKIDTTRPVLNVLYNDEPDDTEGNDRYYKEDVVVTVKVTEEFFAQEKVIVRVFKKDTVDSKELELFQTYNDDTLEWTDPEEKEENVHEAVFHISGDGHYVVKITCTDAAGNTTSPEEYVSDTITIDTVEPVVGITYKEDAKPVASSEGTRDYFNNHTTTTVVTIEEHNFDPEKVSFLLVGTDVGGKQLGRAEGSDPVINGMISATEWKNDGDRHVIELTYTADANYALQVNCTDLSGRDGGAAGYLTVDVVAPQTTVSYSTSVLETVLSGVSFGFYNAKVTVTITAADDTSGVQRFDYSYLTAAGVSSVNAQFLNQVMEGAAITYSNDGRTATMTFEIPREALGGSNQFNGTVKFDAIDRAGNKAEKSEGKRIVVDNIAPTAAVSYNTPVREENGISYYDGAITGTVTIREANFYAEDVFLTVSKDGGSEQALTTVWSDTSADVHVGTFTLTDDADYIVAIRYRDKSGNTMAEYKSNQLTIDTEIEEPVYSINGTDKAGDNGGAYKDEVHINFRFEDQNFDTQTVQLVRTRFNETKDVTADFVKVDTDTKGGSGSFALAKDVDNDGIYVLTVTMTDKAGHSTQSYVKFTVNRYGSVYEYSDYLSDLIKDGGQYVARNGDFTVAEDLVITEYNADRIVSGSLRIVITRDGEMIDTMFAANPEASDSTEIGSSGWYQYVYTISRDNFIQDGVYNITITTKDATGNTSTSIPDNSLDANGDKILDVMTFTVDTTAPEIRNIVGLEKKIINAQEQTVRYTIIDIGGLQRVEVMVDGAIVDTITDFGDDPGSFTGEFKLSESNDAQTVRIVVTDRAGNVTDTSSDEFDPHGLYDFNDVVTISTNFFVRWYANTALFWGSIGGIIVVAAGICTFIAVKRRKKTSKQ